MHKRWDILVAEAPSFSHKDQDHLLMFSMLNSQYSFKQNKYWKCTFNHGREISMLFIHEKNNDIQISTMKSWWDKTISCSQWRGEHKSHYRCKKQGN